MLLLKSLNNLSNTKSPLRGSPQTPHPPFFINLFTFSSLLSFNIYPSLPTPFYASTLLLSLYSFSIFVFFFLSLYIYISIFSFTMPTTKNHHRNNARLAENAMSATQLRRPRTVPDLVSYGHKFVGGAVVPEGLPRQPPKVLLKVTVLGSLAAVQVLMRPESSVGDLVEGALRQYVKEGRRPILPSMKAFDFDLHYSQFSLESLDRDEKLIDLGSRNFFMCPRKCVTAVEGGGGGGREDYKSAPFASCGNEVSKVRQGGGGDRHGAGFGWFKLMHFLLP